MLFSAWISSSQPLHEPASTSRIESERLGKRSLHQAFKQQRAHLKIVPRVRAVERLIAEREVGDDVNKRLRNADRVSGAQCAILQNGDSFPDAAL
jgi:hypothetical protein